MTLQLDARRRAMLEEMGVRLFWPEAAVEDSAPGEAVAASSAPVAPPVVAAPHAPVHAAPMARPPAAPVARPQVAAAPAGLESLDWDALAQAVSDWAAGLGRTAVFGAGDVRAEWFCVGDPPLEEEERQATPFAGDGGRLLDNMLAAVGESQRRGAYLTNVVKCRLPEGRAQDAQVFAPSRAFLQRQVELVRPRVILALGRFAAQGLLQSDEPLGRLRGRVHRFGDVPVVVTYHPAYLLRNLPEKARAWADLCLARSVVRAGH